MRRLPRPDPGQDLVGRHRPADAVALRHLWARSRIQQLSDQEALEGGSGQREAITALGRGVAGLIDRHCNRVFKRGSDVTQDFRGGVGFVLLSSLSVLSWWIMSAVHPRWLPCLPLREVGRIITNSGMINGINTRQKETA